MAEVTFEFSQYLGRKLAIVLQNTVERMNAVPGPASNLRIFIGGGKARFTVKSGCPIFARKLMRKLSCVACGKEVMLAYDLLVNGVWETRIKKYLAGEVVKTGIIVKSNENGISGKKDESAETHEG